MSIENCKSVSQVNKVLKEQGIDIPAWKLGSCGTIIELINLCKSYGAK